MNIWIYISLVLVLLFSVFCIARLYFTLKIRKKKEDPIVDRVKMTIYMINQKIPQLMNQITKMDQEITRLLAQKENIVISDNKKSEEVISQEINEKQKDINEKINLIKDLKQYKDYLEKEIKNIKKLNHDEIEKLLDLAKDKLSHRAL